MKSGMLAAEAIAQDNLENYPDAFKHSWAYEELYLARNIRPMFRFGLFPGLLHAAIDTFLFRGRAPWTFKNHADHKQLEAATHHAPIEYPKPDGVLTFDKLSSVFLSSTNHEEDQPCHLTLKDSSVTAKLNWPLYGSPEQRYCPAGVYEIIKEGDAPRLQINAQNCLHCKSCDIKDPSQNIVWKTPEGGGGPNYGEM